jgi:methionyl-tRNA formyltransferase
MQFCFGKINKYILLGGGPLFSAVLDYGLSTNKELLIYVAERLLSGDSHIEGVSCEEFLKKTGVHYTVTDSIASHYETIEEFSDDNTLALSLNGTWIFRERIINAVNGKFINGHATRLPDFRGGGGFSWRILRGDTAGYVTWHIVTPGIDDGDILYMKEFRLPETCRTPGDFDTYTTAQMVESVPMILGKIDSEQSFDRAPQSPYFGSYWPRLHTETHGYIDWSWSATDIESFTCAFDDPFKGASTFWNGARIFLKNSQRILSEGRFHPFQQGIIYRRHSDCIYVAANDGAILVAGIFDEEGKSIMNDLQVGDRLYTPKDVLEEAMHTRVFYTSTSLKK